MRFQRYLWVIPAVFIAGCQMLPYYEYTNVPAELPPKGLVLVTAPYIPGNVDALFKEFKIQRDPATDEKEFQELGFPTIARDLARSGWKAARVADEDAKPLIGTLDYDSRERIYAATHWQAVGPKPAKFWTEGQCKKCISELLAKKKAQWLLIPITIAHKAQGAYQMGNGHCMGTQWAEGIAMYLLFGPDGELAIESGNMYKKNIFRKVGLGTTFLLPLTIERLDRGVLSSKCSVKAVSVIAVVSDAFARMNYWIPVPMVQDTHRRER